MNKSLTVVVNLEEDVDTCSETLCEVCLSLKPKDQFIIFSYCKHSFCLDCVRIVFEANVNESRVNLQCLRCSQGVCPNEVQSVLDPVNYEKYLNFTLRKFLASHKKVSYCLTPDCPYACINSSSNKPSKEEERNHFVCRREECSSEYCNKCKRPWHSGMTCEELTSKEGVDSNSGISEELKKAMGTKNCPSCGAMIEKLRDGTCNQVTCSVCHVSFCWLCGKEVNEMHYLSPTGCPLYGNRMWSRRKKCCVRFWLWFLAPLFIVLISLLALPLTFIVYPLVCGFLTHKKTRKWNKVLRVLLTILAIFLCVLTSPLVALLVFVIMFPVGLLYFYCFIPIHLCTQS